MLKRIFTLLVLMMLTLPAAAQSWTIEPGVGVGPIKLGASPQDLATFLNGTELVGSRNNPRFIKYGATLLAEFSVMKVVMVSVHNAQVETKQGSVGAALPGGISVGTPFSMVETSWGRNYDARPLKVAKGQPAETYYAYRAKGAGFRVQGNRIVQIDVWNKAY